MNQSPTEYSLQREYDRVPMDILVRVRSEDFDCHLKCANLSAGGVFFSSNIPLPAGAEVYLEFNFASLRYPVKIKASVVWSQEKPPIGFAVKFTEIGYPERLLVENLVMEQNLTTTIGTS